MPSWLSAFMSPWFASELKPRSFRPPMSVTSPTLIGVPPVVWLGPLEPAAPLVSPLLPPQPAAAMAIAAVSRSPSASHDQLRLPFTEPPLSPFPAGGSGRCYPAHRLKARTDSEALR